MRSLTVPIATLAAVLSFPAAASMAQSATTSAQANALTDRYMTPVDTELTSKVDTKNAAAGQAVTAKTRAAARLADGTALPKGTKLVGHVTQVEAYLKGHAGSMVAMTFDHAELKNGQSVALRSVIRKVGPPANLAANADPMADMQAGPAGVSAGAGGAVGTGAGGTGAGRGGGLGAGGGGGGLAGGPVRGVGQTAGGIGQTAGSGVGGVAGGVAGGAAGDTRSMAEKAVDAGGGVVSQAGETTHTAVRSTGLPGVMLSHSDAANVSGVLTAEGRNISLENGTQITLGVIAQ